MIFGRFIAISRLPFQLANGYPLLDLPAFSNGIHNNSVPGAWMFH